MQRFDGANAVTVLPTRQAAQSSPGYFYDGNSTTGDPSSVPGADWFNQIQEEVCAVIEAADITLDRTDNTQLLQAITALMAATAVPAIPVGVSVMYNKTTAPTGWLLEDGKSIGNTGSGADHTGPEFETLFNILKYTENNTGLESFAGGDIVYLDNTIGRTIVGLDLTALLLTGANNIGKTLGSVTATVSATIGSTALTTAQVPPHKHETPVMDSSSIVTSWPHGSSGSYSASNEGGAGGQSGPVLLTGPMSATGTAQGHTHTFNPQPVSTVQPAITKTFIIKY